MVPSLTKDFNGIEQNVWIVILRNPENGKLQNLVVNSSDEDQRLLFLMLKGIHPYPQDLPPGGVEGKVESGGAGF